MSMIPKYGKDCLKEDNIIFFSKKVLKSQKKCVIIIYVSNRSDHNTLPKFYHSDFCRVVSGFLMLLLLHQIEITHFDIIKMLRIFHYYIYSHTKQSPFYLEVYNKRRLLICLKKNFLLCLFKIILFSLSVPLLLHPKFQKHFRLYLI